MCTIASKSQITIAITLRADITARNYPGGGQVACFQDTVMEVYLVGFEGNESVKDQN